MRLGFIFLLLALGSQALGAAKATSINEVILRVKLYGGSPRGFSLKKNGFRIDLKKSKIYYGNASKAFSGSKIKSAVINVSQKRALKLNGSLYAGRFSFFLNKHNQCLIVQSLPLETYVAGVLAGEISPSWDIEAVKAQALAARTFAFHHYLARQKKLYHIVASTSHQVFSGLSRRHPIYTQAVKQTKDEIITHQGKPILAFFNANCGGRTETAQEAWKGGQKLGYLKYTKSPYAKTDPQFNWKLRLDKDRLSKAFSDYLKGAKVRSVRVSQRTRSGRCKVVEISTRRGRIAIPGSVMRSRLGDSVVKSTFFQIRRVGKEIYLHGKGYGHGVGLCQWSAKTMAERGYAYQNILRRFYKNIRLQKINQLFRSRDLLKIS